LKRKWSRWKRRLGGASRPPATDAGSPGPPLALAFALLRASLDSEPRSARGGRRALGAGTIEVSMQVAVS
jgi:hypothetical protein